LEDEKFSYICTVREKCSLQGMRVLRHPLVHSGFVQLEVCTQEGIRNIKLSKKDGEKYKKQERPRPAHYCLRKMPEHLKRHDHFILQVFNFFGPFYTFPFPGFQVCNNPVEFSVKTS